MEIDGWLIPIERLPYYVPAEKQWSWNKLLESPDSSHAALFYCVHEPRNGLDVGRLAVFRRSTPVELVLTVPGEWLTWTHDQTHGWISNTLFVARGFAPREVPLVVVDLERKRFGFIHGHWKSAVVDDDDGLTVMPVDWDSRQEKQSFRFDELSWFGFEHHGQFREAYNKSAHRHGVSTEPYAEPWHRWIWEAVGFISFTPFWLVDRAINLGSALITKVRKPSE